MRLCALAAGVLFLMVTACSDSSEPERSTSTGHGTTALSGLPGLPEPTPGSKWLGINSVMIAAPRSWAVTQDPCERNRIGTAQFLDEDSPALRCLAYVSSGALLVVIEIEDEELFRGLKRRSTVNGLEVSGSTLGCRTSMPPICSLTFSVPSEHVIFSVTYRARNAVQVIRSIRDSLRSIPGGYSAVPLIQYGWSVEQAQRHLRAAGLESSSPSVDWPHYVTDIEPTGGTVLQQGEVVELSIGDG